MTKASKTQSTGPHQQQQGASTSVSQSSAPQTRRPPVFDSMQAQPTTSFSKKYDAFPPMQVELNQDVKLKSQDWKKVGITVGAAKTVERWLHKGDVPLNRYSALVRGCVDDFRQQVRIAEVTYKKTSSPENKKSLDRAKKEFQDVKRTLDAASFASTILGQQRAVMAYPHANSETMSFTNSLNKAFGKNIYDSTRDSVSEIYHNDESKSPEELAKRFMRRGIEAMSEIYDLTLHGTNAIPKEIMAECVRIALDESEADGPHDRLLSLEKLRFVFLAMLKGYSPSKTETLRESFSMLYDVVNRHCQIPADNAEQYDRVARRYARGLATLVAATGQYVNADKQKWDNRAGLVMDAANIALGTGSLAPAGANPAFVLAGVIVGRLVDRYMKSAMNLSTANQIAGMIGLEVARHQVGLTPQERQLNNDAANAFGSTLTFALMALPLDI